MDVIERTRARERPRKPLLSRGRAPSLAEVFEILGQTRGKDGAAPSPAARRPAARRPATPR